MYSIVIFRLKTCYSYWTLNSPLSHPLSDRITENLTVLCFLCSFSAPRIIQGSLYLFPFCTISMTKLAQTAVCLFIASLFCGSGNLPSSATSHGFLITSRRLWHGNQISLGSQSSELFSALQTSVLVTALVQSVVDLPEQRSCIARLMLINQSLILPGSR